VTGLTVNQLIEQVIASQAVNDDLPLAATTPHRSYRFEVTEATVEEDGTLLLHLREVGPDEHFVIVDTHAWHLQHPMSCRDVGLEKCRLTALVQVGVEAGHVVMGRSRVWLDEAGVLLWDDPEPLQVTKL
jgi:hypothetical protein